MKGIRVKNLFGNFDYQVSLCEGGLTIITGPNGFGKSTIIKCIRAVSESDLAFFYDLQFEEIELQMENETDNLLIKKVEDGLEINGDYIESIIIRRGKNALRMRRRDLDMGMSERERKLEVYHDIIGKMQRLLGKVEYIEEQRLIISAEESDMSYASMGIRSDRVHRVIQTVEEIPGKMEKQIRTAAIGYSKVANELDSTFPIRLFHENEGIEKMEFDDKIELMQEKVKKLEKYRISDVGTVEGIEYRQEDARALKVYFEDFEKKYEEYAPLIEKMDLFTEMVNSRFRFKKLEISGDEGIIIQDDYKRKISLLKLSSGEKETLVLFFQLLFEVEDNSLLLIDEPEISLHVAWQRMFAEDLKKIIEKKKMNVIVATHSAQIVNGNRDIQIDLGEIYKNGLN